MRNRYFRRVVLLLALACPSEAEVRISLTGGRITAGDLAAVMPRWSELEPSTQLGPAPLPGVYRRVSRGQLMAWARFHGLELEPEQVPEQLLLVREMRRLSSAECLEIIRRAVSRRYGRAVEDVRFTPEDFVQPLVPAGPLDFSAVGPRAYEYPVRDYGRRSLQVARGIGSRYRRVRGLHHRGEPALQPHYSVYFQGHAGADDRDRR